MSDKVAFIFPGQGAQSVGMCRTLYEKSPVFRDTIHKIEEISYQPIWRYVSEGPEKELKKSDRCQLALFAVGLATYHAVSFERPNLKPLYCAGLSLGEYTALCAAGILDLEEAVHLLLKRSQLMQEACLAKEGKMAAVLGLSFDAIEAAVSQYPKKGDLALANYNANQQIVVAGTTEAITWFESKATSLGARRFVYLEVAGAFHSPLMEPAMKAYKPYVETARINYSEIQVVSNVTGKAVEYVEDLRELMVEQICAPVMWCSSMEYLEQEKGITLFVEMGPGKILQGLNRRITQRARTVSIESIEDITHFL